MFYANNRFANVPQMICKNTKFKARALTPMYLLARVIKSMGIKMVLSGEGSDEIFGGYL